MLKGFLKSLMRLVIVGGCLAALMWAGYSLYMAQARKIAALEKIVGLLEADSRVAEVVVTEVSKVPETGRARTTIKFLEYDAAGRPLTPRYFTFTGNVIQFQSLVIRFRDDLIRAGDRLKGKSAYLFWKAFVLDGEKTQEFVITPLGETPRGYSLEDERLRPYELEIWQRFWEYALDPGMAGRMGIKNAQIEAPGARFVPGYLYTIVIEHDGGLRIDASPVPDILRGEKVL